MRRSILVLVACAAALTAAGRAQAQFNGCSDNCGGTNVGGGNPWMGLPLQPPGPPETPPGQRVSRSQREQSTAENMTRAGLAALVTGQSASPQAAAVVRTLLTTRDSSAALNGVRVALDGTRWQPSAGKPSPAERGTAATNAAQRAQAARVATLLNGLLVEGQKPARLFARVTEATRAFNQLVAVADRRYLNDPPAEFVLVHEVLTQMIAGQPPAAPPTLPSARQNVSVWVVTPTTPTGLTQMTALYDPATGDTTIAVNGTLTPLRSAFTAVPTAAGASWYIAGQPLILGTDRDAPQYVSFGTPRRIDPSDLIYIGTTKGLPVFAARSDAANLSIPSPPSEIATNPALQKALWSIPILYVPLTPYGAVFQPIHLQQQVRKVRID